jgi:hypothetical protein
MISVFRIAPPEITATWERVVGFFAPIFADCKTHNEEDVRLSLLIQTSQLWIQWNAETKVIEAAFVTEFANYPRGLWVRLWLAGVNGNVKVDYDAVRGAITVWAKQNKALGFEITGRQGWLRKLCEARLEGVCLRSVFDGGR